MAIFETRTCKDCWKDFDIDMNEKTRFEQLGLEFPKRCFPCRKKKRERNNTDVRGTHQIVLIRADFEKLLRGEEVSFKQNGCETKIILAKIGIKVIKNVIEEVLAGTIEGDRI